MESDRLRKDKDEKTKSWSWKDQDYQDPDQDPVKTLVTKMKKEKKRNEKSLYEDAERITKGIASGQLSLDLEWMDSLFVAAARQEIFWQVIKEFETSESKATFESMAKHALGQVLQGAMNPKKSSSTCATHVYRCRLQAWAEVLEVVEQIEQYGVTL